VFALMETGEAKGTSFQPVRRLLDVADPSLFPLESQRLRMIVPGSTGPINSGSAVTWSGIEIRRSATPRRVSLHLLDFGRSEEQSDGLLKRLLPSAEDLRENSDPRVAGILVQAGFESVEASPLGEPCSDASPSTAAASPSPTERRF
jgi:hypothetical protein